MAKILVVDDNTMIRELLRVVLESGGHVVEEASDGDVALQFDLAGFDMVLTDICMPRVSGFEVVRGAVAARVPTIAISGGDRLSGQDPLVEALGLGAMLALRKPFSVPQVLKSIAECLGGSPPSPAVIEFYR